MPHNLNLMELTLQWGLPPVPKPFGFRMNAKGGHHWETGPPRDVQSRGPDGAGDLQPGDKWHEKSDSSLLAVGDVVIKLNFNSDFEQKILKIKFRQDFEAKIWSLFCFWLEDVYWSLNNKYFRREGLLRKNWIYNLCESRTKKNRIYMEEEKVIHHIYGRSHNTLHFNKTCSLNFRSLFTKKQRYMF